MDGHDTVGNEEKERERERQGQAYATTRSTDQDADNGCVVQPSISCAAFPPPPRAVVGMGTAQRTQERSGGTATRQDIAAHAHGGGGTVEARAQRHGPPVVAERPFARCECMVVLCIACVVVGATGGALTTTYYVRGDRYAPRVCANVPADLCAARCGCALCERKWTTWAAHEGATPPMPWRSCFDPLLDPHACGADGHIMEYAQPCARYAAYPVVVFWFMCALGAIGLAALGFMLHRCPEFMSRPV